MNYIYRLLDRIPKGEYPSSVRMNISRINSTRGRKAGFTIIRADNINLKIKCKSYNNRTPEWTMGIFFLALDEFKPDD